MDFIKEPMTIENRSMELIAPHLAELHLDERETKLYSRLIHASGDVGYAPITRVHPQAIDAAIAALKRGVDIYTDVEMVRTGINKKKLASFGGTVHCLVADPDVAARAKAEGITRSMVAMRTFGKDMDGSIVAIGNAPTALFEVLRLVREEGDRKSGSAGMPRPPVSSVFPSALSVRQSPRQSSPQMTSFPTLRSKGRRAAAQLRRRQSMR